MGISGTGRRWHKVALLAVVIPALLAPAPSVAHEIPSDVTIRLFVRPSGERLEVLARVPLEAMRDFEFPIIGPGYLDLDVIEPMLHDAAMLWIAEGLRFLEGGRPLSDPRLTAARVSLPSDRSFRDHASALAHVRGPRLPASERLVREQALLDVALEFAIASERSDFAVEPTLAHLGMRTTTVLRFTAPDRPERAFQLLGDPGLVRLDPRWHQAALRFVILGFFHILAGWDHLLFLLCLVVPFRRIGPLVPVVTSFTVAHSITLIAAAFGLAPRALWFPPLIEMLIALSIVVMAIENITGARRERRWLMAFGFGLVHGFGFSFLLAESLQFAGSHLVTSLLAFNVGVELGQLLVVALAVPAVVLTFRRLVDRRAGTIVLSALLAHSGWHWMTERASALAQYRFRWPALDAAFLAAAMRGLMLLLIMAAALWILTEVFGRLNRSGWARADPRSRLLQED